MTTKITYRIGVSEDCYSTTGYTEVRNNMLDADAELTVVDDDVFRIEAKPDSAVDDEWCYYKKTVSTTTTLSPSYVYRYKTGDTSPGVGAAISCVVGGAEEFILGSLTVPIFSSEWAYSSGNFSGTGAITEIRFYANDYPDNVTGGASHYVYYDFLLLGNIFTFPYVSKAGRSGGVSVHMEKPYGKLELLNRYGDIHHDGGLSSPQIFLDGDIDTRTAWLTSPVAKALYWIMLKDDLFQWFEDDQIACKVVPVSFDVMKVAGSGKKRHWALNLEQYSRSSATSSTWSNLEWLGFTT